MKVLAAVIGVCLIGGVLGASVVGLRHNERSTVMPPVAVPAGITRVGVDQEYDFCSSLGLLVIEPSTAS